MKALRILADVMARLPVYPLALESRARDGQELISSQRLARDPGSIAPECRGGRPITPVSPMRETVKCIIRARPPEASRPLWASTG